MVLQDGKYTKWSKVVTLLCYGYMYTKKVSRNSCVLWECSERRGLKCKSTLTTDISIENVISKKNIATVVMKTKCKQQKSKVS